MSSLSKKDRVSLCLFTFSDGRRCRTPRIATHPHFCFYHAQQESQAAAVETLAKDLDSLFSGDYLSACDLSTALARLTRPRPDSKLLRINTYKPSRNC
jgi:hypothetical protein